MAKRFSIAFLVALTLLHGFDCQLAIDDKLRDFLGVLEPYSNEKNEVIFVLDESGSIGDAVFPQVVRFTELMSRFLTVSYDYSRLAVVTFSTDTRTHVDYIRNGIGKNMCTFIPALEKIDYAGGWTHTGDAMIVAREIFAHARPNSNRIIILLTDGRSNGGYDLISISTQLKTAGVIIFTVGVADVNEDELNAISTSKKHIYILKDFSQIQQFNDYLKNDTKEILDKVSDTSLCSSFCSSGVDCCDSNADCYCGAKGGNFECGCRPGFTGNGHKGKCDPCMKGTYKSEAGSNACTACPANSTTVGIGSKSRADCFCIAGHRGDPSTGKPCKPVECNPLKAPEGGVILPSNCGNLYGSECTFKCLVGYCPYVCSKTGLVSGDLASLPWNFYPKEARHCLENGTWSGPDFHCEKIKCPVLDHPKYGTHNCSALQTDFSFNTVCHFTCDKGFFQSGSQYRKCLEDGSWTGEKTTCNTEKCKPLKSNAVLRVRPKYCTKKDGVEFGTVCYYGCQEGYNLTSRSVPRSEKFDETTCRVGGKWSEMKDDLFCKDVKAPTIKCPNSISRNTDPGSSKALVTWDLPDAEDNTGSVDSVELIHPPHIRKPPAAFEIGSTKIVYEATDSSNNSDTCSFTVTVNDIEPPQILFCPKDIEVFHSSKGGVNVTWKEPVFKDNSGNVSEAKPSRTGLFHWGPPNFVNYVVSDPHGNSATCSFSVKVKPYPCPYVEPPANGFLSCDKWTNGQLCQVSCRDGYAFPTPPEKIYFCSAKSREWTRPFDKSGKPVVFPWPDCGEMKPPNGISMNVSVYAVDNCSNVDTLEVKKNFIESFKGYLSIFCRNKGCHPDNVDVSCKTSVSQSGNVRKKRSHGDYVSLEKYEWAELNDGRVKTFGSVRARRSSENRHTLVLSFDLKGTENCSDSCEISSSFMDSAVSGENIEELLEPTMNKFLQEAYHLENVSASYYDYTHVPTCEVGRVLENGTCISCPVGTYYDVNVKKCMVCPSGTYQDVEGSLSCKECPHGILTMQSRSKRIEDCKAPCKPGFYSSSGLEPCTPCAVGTYQTEWASTYCVPCQNGRQTGFTGANSSLHCAYPCNVGSYSLNGFPPCMLCPFGTYQPEKGKTSCTPCPSGTTTVVEGAHKEHYCQTVHFCEDYKPCANGATCIDMENGYECICLPGFASRNCDVNINDCSRDSCENNGTCIDLVNGFLCECQPGYTGEICETDIDDCESGPCEHDGKCIDLVDDYSCKCVDGLTGRNCEINIDDCISNPCLNGGTCFDGLNGFRCCCPEGYSGQTCEVKEDLCDSVTCFNGGSCVSTSHNASCVCAEGFEGSSCEININDCEIFDPCLNGGTCIDGINNTTCACTSRYEGHHCEHALATEYVLQFPYPPATSNYVKIPINKHLFAITVSFFMQSFYVFDNNRGTPISYSYYDTQKDVLVDNALTLFDTNKFVLYLHGQSFHTGLEANSNFHWHHYAITWDSLDGTWAFYLDGEKLLSGTDVAHSQYLHPGFFVLGQEQDSLGGGFSTFEAFAGNITEFNVWDYTFLPEEVKQLSSQCGFLGNLIAWPSVQLSMTGSLSKEMDNGLSPCHRKDVCSPDNCLCKMSNSSSGVCKHTIHFAHSCTPNPCMNGQTCDLDAGVAVCSCSEGFDGKICQYDINECLVNNGNCSHVCSNTVGSYYCSCPDGLVLKEDGHTCVDISFCKVGDKIFLNDEKWESGCEECVCELGSISCKEKLCSNVNCSEDEYRVLLPGQCCEECIDRTSCIVSPNSKIESFDGFSFAMQGKCRYLLAKDNIDGTFAIHMEDANDGHGKLTTVHALCSKVSINSLGDVTVNGENVSLPFVNEDVFLEGSNSSIILWTYNGLSIRWTTSGLIDVGVPMKFKRKVSGLCGNFNGVVRDDMTTRQLSHVEKLWESDGCKFICEDIEGVVDFSKSACEWPLKDGSLLVKSDSIYVVFSVFLAFAIHILAGRKL